MNHGIGTKRSDALKRLPIVNEWQCARTGECCQSGPRVSAAEYALLAERYMAPLPATMIGTQFIITGQPCPFLNGSSCSVYDIRPYKCRQFQCQRAPNEPLRPGGPMGCYNLSERVEQSRAVRRAYELNQRKAQRWALKHGWKGDEA